MNRGMKGYLIFILWWAISALGAKSMGEDWAFVREGDGVSLWKLKSDARTIGTLRSHKRKAPVNWNSIRSEAFFKNLTKEKRRMLGLMGISQWEAQDYQWRRQGNAHELSLRGTYMDSRRQKMAFREHHFYTQEATHQVLLVSPEDKRLDPSKAQAFVEKAKELVLP